MYLIRNIDITEGKSFVKTMKNEIITDNILKIYLIDLKVADLLEKS